MVFVCLVLIILMYLGILLGLTIWFERYHYYRNVFVQQLSTKTDEFDKGLPITTPDLQGLDKLKSGNWDQVKRGVQEGEND